MFIMLFLHGSFLKCLYTECLSCLNYLFSSQTWDNVHWAAFLSRHTWPVNPVTFQLLISFFLSKDMFCLRITLQEIETLIALFPIILKYTSQDHWSKSNNKFLFSVTTVSWCPGPCVSCHRACMTAWVYSFFRLKPLMKRHCSIITGNSTATLCEIHVTLATGKLNMSPRGLNIPLLYKCNLVWCICHDALPVREEIIHRDWMDKGQRRTSPLCYTVIPSAREWKTFCSIMSFSFWR